MKTITKDSYTVHLWDFTWQDEFYLLQQSRAKDATIILIKNRFLNRAGIDNYYKKLLLSYPKGLLKWIRIKMGLFNQ